MDDPGKLALFWTLCDVGFRWFHVAGMGVGLGGLALLHFTRGARSDAAGASALLRHPLAAPALAWLRWAVALGWTAGMLLLFSHYYHALLGPILLDANLPLDALELLTKDNGHPNVRAWLPGFLALLAGYGAYELLFHWTRGAAQSAAAVVAGALWIGVGWLLDVQCHYSGRATWVHLGAIGGGVVAGNVWLRIWPAQQRMLEALEHGAPPAPGDLRLVRSRLAHCVHVGFAVLMFMLATHYPVLYGDNPWPWPAVAACVLAASTATVSGLSALGCRSG